MIAPHWSASFSEWLRLNLPLDITRPVYVVADEEVFKQFQGEKDTVAYTNSHLSLRLKPDLERLGIWQGPGHAIQLVDLRWCVVNLMNLLFHELAHCIAGQSQGMNRELEIAGHLDELAGVPVAVPPERFRPQWDHHESRWIRCCCHLVRRVRQAGLDVTLQGMGVAGCAYGLSAPERYRDSLDGETQRRCSEPIIEILESDAPAEFSALWERDTAPPSIRLHVPDEDAT